MNNSYIINIYTNRVDQFINSSHHNDKISFEIFKCLRNDLHHLVNIKYWLRPHLFKHIEIIFHIIFKNLYVYISNSFSLSWNHLSYLILLLLILLKFYFYPNKVHASPPKIFKNLDSLKGYNAGAINIMPLYLNGFSAAIL
jgi:hypothetical protein